MKKGELAYEFNPGITYPAYLTRKRLLASIRKSSKDLTGRMLDFGCGTKPYFNLFKVEQYIGLDFENPGHPHFNEQIDVFYDGKHIPFQDNYFDAVFSSEVFEHVFNLEEVLKEIYRVMKPGAKILITCPFSICEHEAPNDFARYSSFAIRDLFNRNGFKVLKQEKTGNAVETVFQLWIMYIHQHITPYVRKIPIVRSVFRFITYTSLNIMALILGKLLPLRQDLYLNNVVLAEKNNLS
ncbi:methyltransferase domain-containing protein [Panacibacter sp. DH6]|uniref:Methyltransferase domain-containing protein n=1 Tax=Panacibacter microcysteis TaxID=2793269 RepID=A0A931E8S7_9BACT|nr:class I SAM-dependent methyltransferase [Panacibacter microcysteis]MBG9377466.1 methyltransferase domain-containing protein [Panacibacter microcysteis]